MLIELDKTKSSELEIEMASFNANDVLQAMVDIRRNGLPQGFSPSRKWDIIDPDSGERFPPKAILYRAKEIAGDTSYSGGGGDRGTNNALRDRNFIVVMKEDRPDIDINKVAVDIEEVNKSKLDQTTKRQLIEARLGQGIFRAALLEIWSGSCALTGLCSRVASCLAYQAMVSIK